MDLRGATWIWWCMLVLIMPSLAMEEVESVAGKNQIYRTIPYDIPTGRNGYTNFLKELHDAVAVTKVCEIQTLSSTPSFIYVQLRASSTKFITIALQTTDLYVLGYTDNIRVDGETRARFFQEVTQDTMNKLFPGIQTKTNKIFLSENYNDLEPETRFKRLELDLRMITIQEVFDEVYGKSVADLEKKDKRNGRSEANFLFVMCQMIAEATRFKFMEMAIITNVGTKPISEEIMAFQNNWNKAAKAIHKSNDSKPKCENLEPPLEIAGGISYKKVYTKVKDLRAKIAVIKPRKTLSSPQNLQYLSNTTLLKVDDKGERK